MLETEHDDRDRDACASSTASRPARAQPCLVRIVEGLAGAVDDAARARRALRLRLDRAVGAAASTDGWRAIAGPDGLELRTPIAISGEDLRTVAEFTVARRRTGAVRARLVPVARSAPTPRRRRAALVSETDDEWRAWSAQCVYHGEWRDDGAALAAHARVRSRSSRPAASSPRRRPRCPRRSAARATGTTGTAGCATRRSTLEALLIGGYRDEAARWRRVAAARGRRAIPRRCRSCTASAGERRLTELELDWLPGYEGSRPVRIGNAAHAQLQLDVYGELADVLWQAARAGFALERRRVGAAQLLLTESLEERGASPTRASGRCAARAATSRTRRCCAGWRSTARSRWSSTPGARRPGRHVARDPRRDPRRRCATRGYNEELGAFTQSYDDDRARRVGADDPARRLPARRRSARRVDDRRDRPRRSRVDGLRACATTRTDERRRHRRAGGRVPAVQLLDGRGARARRPARRGRGALFERLLDARQRRRPVRRGVRPGTRRLLGNFPQAFTHLALVAAAHTAREPDRVRRRPADRDRAARDRRESAGGASHSLRAMALVTNVVQGIRLANGCCCSCTATAPTSGTSAACCRTSTPTASFATVLPRAPIAVPGTPGYAWYEFGGRRRPAATATRSPSSTTWSTSSARRSASTARDAIFGGFSQGAGLALGLGAAARASDARPAGVLAMSPALDARRRSTSTRAIDVPGARAARHRRPADPGAALARPRPRRCATLGVPTVYREYPMEHQVALESLRDAADVARRWCSRASGPTKPCPRIRSSSSRRSRPRSGKREVLQERAAGDRRLLGAVVRAVPAGVADRRDDRRDAHRAPTRS